MLVISGALVWAKRVQQSTIYAAKKINVCCGKIVCIKSLTIRPPLHVSGCEMSHLLALSTKHKKSVFNLIISTSMFCSIDSCQNRVSFDQCHMTISLAQVYNSLRCHAIFKFSADQLLVNFQSITDSGSFFRRISVCFLLTQNLNYFGKAFFKRFP